MRDFFGVRFALVSTLAMVFAAFLAAPVQGQSINIDLDSTSAPVLGGGVPSSAFPGAAGQPGVWNSYLNTAGPVALVNLAGGPTTATLSITASSTAINVISFNNPTNTGDFALFFNDSQQIGTTAQGGTRTYTFSGLLDGPYAVYTYGVPNNGNPGELLINVPGSNEGQLITAGPMPGNAFVLGVTHQIHTLNVVGGTFSINMTDNPAAPTAHVNGFQITLVPEPAALALLALAPTVMRRRRR